MSAIKIVKELGLIPKSVKGEESTFDCIFCGKADKLCINTVSGLWQCWSSSCGKSGNLDGFLFWWWNHWREENESEGYKTPEWETLRDDRGISIDVLVEAGIINTGPQEWWIPIFSQEKFNGTGRHRILNLMRYRLGEKLRGLPTLDRHLWGLHNFREDEKHVYLCEGEWDGIALWGIEGSGSNILASPGANIFKDDWCKFFKGRSSRIIYDNDSDGEKGTDRVIGKIGPSASEILVIKWLDKFPTKFDVRDFLKAGGTLDDLNIMLVPASATSGENGRQTGGKDDKPAVEFPRLSKDRPSFEITIEKYRKWLYMTPDLEKAIRLAFAVVIANQIPGDPLWVYLVGPPASGKTEVLNSIGELEGCVMASSITSRTLISGFPGEGDKDPSLIPKLIGKVFVLKDFTEVLKMNSVAKDEVYSQLRGAYDGRVDRRFGNNVGLRSYTGHFGMVAGVTPAIFSDSDATLGERFLLFHLFKTKTGVNTTDLILAALENVGDEIQMRKELIEAAKGFLEWKIEREDIPEVSREYLRKVVGICQIVAMLRASIDKNKYSGVISYRPQEEMGNRIAKQLKKLMQATGMLNFPPEVGQAEYELAVRVAMDSCIGFNLEIMFQLIHKPGMTIDELVEQIGIPQTTLQDHLLDLHTLGCIEKVRREKKEGVKGVTKFEYFPSEEMSEYFAMAELDSEIEEYVKKCRIRLKSRRKFDDD